MHLAVWLLWCYKKVLKKPSSTDCTKCSICQNQTQEKLRFTTQGHEALVRLLAEFAKINVLGFDLAKHETQGMTLKESLNTRYCLLSYLFK